MSQSNAFLSVAVYTLCSFFDSRFLRGFFGAFGCFLLEEASFSDADDTVVSRELGSSSS